MDSSVQFPFRIELTCICQEFATIVSDSNRCLSLGRTAQREAEVLTGEQMPQEVDGKAGEARWLGCGEGVRVTASPGKTDESFANVGRIC